MPDEPKIPDGLKVERTASGGFRFDLPRSKLMIIAGTVFAVMAVPFLLFCVGFAVFWAWGWWHQAKGGVGGVLGLLFAVPFVLVPLGMMYGLLRAIFARRALEVDDRAITNCSRLAPLPESRKAIPLEEITGLAVDETRSSKGGPTHYLVVKTTKKEHRLAEGLDREALEWLAARVALLADRARGPAAAAAGGKSLTDTLEADLLRDRIETGEVGPEDLARVDPTEPPPEGAGVDIIERGKGRLVIRLAGHGGGFFLFFSTVWLLITLLVFGGFLFGGTMKGKDAFVLVPFSLLFLGVGVGMLLAGLRQKTLVERLEFRPGSVNWEARSILGTNSRSLTGEIKLSQAVSYEQNYQPVYHLRVTAPDGQKIKFAGNLKREAQVWLLAHVGAVLGAAAVDLPGTLQLPAVRAGELPPNDSGIEVLEQRPELLRARLAGRKDAGLLVFSIIWDAAITFMAVMIIITNHWSGLLFLVPFYAVGIGLMVFAIRQRTLVEEISVRPDGAEMSARSALGKSEKRLSGALTLERATWASSGDKKYYQLLLKDSAGGKLKFAGALKPEAQLWLMARVAAVVKCETTTAAGDPDEVNK